MMEVTASLKRFSNWNDGMNPMFSILYMYLLVEEGFCKVGLLNGLSDFYELYTNELV